MAWPSALIFFSVLRTTSTILGRSSLAASSANWRLDEHQAQRVLEHLHVGVTREVPLAHDVLHACDRRRVVADLVEDRAHVGRVALVQVASASAGSRPGPRGTTCAARPTAGCGGRAAASSSALGRVRSQTGHPCGHQLRVRQLLGPLKARDHDGVGVVGICCVDLRDGAGETLVVRGQRGSPSTRSAMMLRWISDVPPAIVPRTSAGTAPPTSRRATSGGPCWPGRGPRARAPRLP